jgi:hypothetical protein
MIRRASTALSALEITLVPEARGSGNSIALLNTMKCCARANGYRALFAPVRPNQKHLRPHTSMREYISDARAHLPHRIDLHSIDDNSFCLDTDRRCSTASRSMERDSAGIEPGQCDGWEPPIGLGAEERMVDTKAMEVVVEEGDRLV